MKFAMLLCAVFVFVFVGCTKNSTLSPVQSAGCAVETVAVSGAASAIAGALSCANVAAIQTSLQTALGNVNLCSAPVPAPAAVPGLVAAKDAPKWGKISDVSQGDIDAAKHKMKAELAHEQGIVGIIACPIVVNTIIGFGTAQIPPSWGCSASANAAALATTLEAACVAAIPL